MLKPRFLFVLLTLAAVLAVLISSGSTALAATGPAGSPDQIQGGGVYSRLAYQGRLTTSSGSPVTTAVPITFRIYDNNGITVLWTSGARMVTPANGLFTVYLGDTPDPALTGDILARAATIGVTVGADAEMSPRQSITTLVGHSAYGPGVVASSGAGPALNAQSNGADGNHAAYRADNTQASGGVAGYFTNDSNFSTVNLTNSGSGQVLYMVNGYDGNPADGGSFIQAANASQTATLFEVRNNGDVTQDKSANGLAKAAVNVNCTGANSGDANFFNTITGSITVATAGFPTVSCTIDFGFPVNNRFITITNTGQHQQASCLTHDTIPSLPASSLACTVWDAGGNAVPGALTVIIF